MIDDATVRHVARLARLRLGPEEEARMREELSGILEHVERIQALDLDEVPPTTHVVELLNVVREDEPREAVARRRRCARRPRSSRGSSPSSSSSRP